MKLDVGSCGCIGQSEVTLTNAGFGFQFRMIVPPFEVLVISGFSVDFLRASFRTLGCRAIG